MLVLYSTAQCDTSSLPTHACSLELRCFLGSCTLWFFLPRLCSKLLVLCQVCGGKGLENRGGGWVCVGLSVGRWTWCPCHQRLAAETLPFLLLFSQPFPQHLSWFRNHGRSYTCSLGKGDYSPLALSICQKGEYSRTYHEFQHQFFFLHSLSFILGEVKKTKIMLIHSCI